MQPPGPADRATAIDSLYAAFARYPGRARIDGCPCCVADADRAALHAAPLRALRAEDLALFAAKALTTWGDADDYRHFLPRILELATTREAGGWHGFDVGIIASKLELAGHPRWPADERAAIAGWGTWWWATARGRSPDELDAADVAIDLATIQPIDASLVAWADDLRPNALRHLARAVARLGARAPRSPALEAWLRQPARHAALLAAFAADPDRLGADELAHAVDVWELVAGPR